MSELKAIINAYNRLSFSDRIIFYSTISNDIPVNDGNLQSFLTEVRLENGDRCVYCEGTHVVKNGVRKDGVQRYLCRDCRRSFIPSTQSVTSRTRKHFSVWMLQKQAKKSNHRYTTNRMERLTQKRNRKIKDYLHKTSRKVIEIALQTKTSMIVIGNNSGWKQHVALGNRTNQTFVSIPYKTLIDMICYKARLVGIDVRVVNENYTSGTSYLDGENPDKLCYDNKRRISRGIRLVPLKDRNDVNHFGNL